MPIIRIIIVFLFASILADAATTQDAKEQARAATEPRPPKALRAILKAFDKYAIVALGEVHRNQQVHDFILSLTRDASVPGKVNAIVVEFGNGRCQDLMDRYISGEAVSPGELRKIWRDTVNILVWDAPVYKRFFAAIRALNRGLLESKRLRVLLGDPPFDWNEIQTKEEWERLVPRRDPHTAKVIEEEVLAKNHKALLIFGAQHLMRSSAYNRYSSNPQELNLAEILDQRHPGSTLLIWPHTSGYLISELEPRFASWPKLSLAFVKGTWLGTMRIGEPTISPKLEELTDAFLYLGPVRSLRESRPSPELYRDEAYFNELVRRDKIQGGFNRLELEELKKSLLRKPWVAKQR